MEQSITTPSFGSHQENIRFPKWFKFFSKRINYHIVFWLLLFLYNTIYIGYISNYKYSFYSFSLKLPFLVGICYFNNYYLILAFLYTRRYLRYVLGIVVTLVVGTVLLQIALNSLVYMKLCPAQYVADALFSYENTLDKMFSITAIVFFATGLKLSKDWLAQQHKITEITNQQLKTELDFLKLQISPHFLFNTLNNLYALVLKKSDQAPEVVLKFSNMVSYLLYESDHQRASLKKEVEVIRDYLGLEELRFGDRIETDLTIVGETNSFSMPPLILLPFIENCFKHGTRNMLERVTIRIILTITDNSLHLQTVNPMPLKTLEPNKKSGVGLKNVKRRLNLIYGDNHELETNEFDA